MFAFAQKGKAMLRQNGHALAKIEGLKARKPLEKASKGKINHSNAS